MSGQSHYRRQGDSQRHPTRRQSSRDGSPAGRHDLAAKSELSGRPISSPPRQTRCAESDHRDGTQARPFGVSHAQVGTRVRRQGSAVLRESPPRTTGPTAQETSSQARAANRRTRCGLTSLVRNGFWREAEKDTLAVLCGRVLDVAASYTIAHRIERFSTFALCRALLPFATLSC